MIKRLFCILIMACSCIEAMAQAKSTGSFYTIGGTTHFSPQKGKAWNVLLLEDKKEGMDDCVDADDTIGIATDTIKLHLPMVALPLRNIRVNSPFGMRRDPMNPKSRRIHCGLDLKASYEEVFSMLPGKVIATSYSTDGGNYISVSHGVCVCSYLHLSKIKVNIGQHVRAGQLIGISGNTGQRTTGPHLHIACRWDNAKGKYFNPMLLLGFVSEELLDPPPPFRGRKCN